MKIKKLSNLSSSPYSVGTPLILKKNKIIDPYWVSETTGEYPPEMTGIKVKDFSNGGSTPKTSIKVSYNSIQILASIKQGYLPYVKYDGCIGLFKYYGYDNNGELFILFENTVVNDNDSGSSAVNKSISNDNLTKGQIIYSSPLNLTNTDPIWELDYIFVTENGTWGQLSDYAPTSGSSGGSGGITYRNNEGSEER